MTLTTINMNYS